MSYRLDSDITLGWYNKDDIFGDVNDEMRNRKLSKAEYMDQLMTNKYRYEASIGNPKSFTTWMVSNCNHTFGARGRLTYAESMLKSDQKFNIDIFGTCYQQYLNPNHKNLFSRKPKKS